MWLNVWLLFVACTAADDLLWGAYRPNLYVGLRPRLPKSLINGLMWYRSDDFRGVQSLRHDVSNDDSVKKFSWKSYDPHVGGQQVIVDDENHVNLTIDFVKSTDGSSWDLTVKGEQPSTKVLTLPFYFALQGEGHVKLESDLSLAGIEGDVKLTGETADLGNFKIEITEETGRHPATDPMFSGRFSSENTLYTGLKVPDEHSWRGADIYVALMQSHLEEVKQQIPGEAKVSPWTVLGLPNTLLHEDGNFHVFQKTFQGDFEFKIRYGGGTKKKVTSALKSNSEKFSKAFNLEAPFQDAEHGRFASEIIANLLGGLGYFYGDSLVGEGTAPPHELFTLTPSRAFFPRGFYWDEGFHLLALIKYDPDLVLEILTSWFNAMDEEGWIAREQILGPEGRSRVPEEFRVQNSLYANPPTPVMLLAHLSHAPDHRDYLSRLWPKLQTHFDWFRRTQRGLLAEFDRHPPSGEAYRWRGRSPTHVLTSGMDDYPRAPEPNEGELHVDLLSWIGAMAESLSDVANALGLEDETAGYSQIRADVVSNLASLHWSSEKETFCDLTIDEYEEDLYICHIGYVSHLPFMLKLVAPEDTSKLKPLLSQLTNPAQLWSGGGIRSLSKDDPFFGTDENYWRGPVWVQMNWLTLDALQFYAREAVDSGVRAKAKEAYSDLRVAVVSNVYNQWKETGYVWEQYDGSTLKAKGARAFTGWSALVANIMALPETLDDSVNHEDL